MKKVLWACGLAVMLSVITTTCACGWTITKDLEKEVQIKKDAMRQAPNDPNVIFDLAITYSYTNHIEEGLSLLKKVEQVDPAFKNKGYKIYTEKVIKDPADWKLRFRLAFALYFAGRKTEAIRELKNVLIIDPYNVWAYGYIALIYGEMNEIDKAMEAARAGIKIDNLVAALHLLLSQGYYKKGDSWSGFLEAANALRLKAQGY